MACRPWRVPRSSRPTRRLAASFRCQRRRASSHRVEGGGSRVRRAVVDNDHLEVDVALAEHRAAAWPTSDATRLWVGITTVTAARVTVSFLGLLDRQPPAPLGDLCRSSPTQGVVGPNPHCACSAGRHSPATVAAPRPPRLPPTYARTIGTCARAPGGSSRTFGDAVTSTASAGAGPPVRVPPDQSGDGRPRCSRSGRSRASRATPSPLSWSGWAASRSDRARACPR